MLYPLLIYGRLHGMCCMRRLLCCPASGPPPHSAPLTAAAPTRSAAQQRAHTYVYHMQAHMSIQSSRRAGTHVHTPWHTHTHAHRIYEHERRCTSASQTCTPPPCTNLLVLPRHVVHIDSRVRIRVRVRSICRCPSCQGHISGRARAPPLAARSDRTSLQIIRPRQQSNATTNTRPCAH
jgi:hypothetical protein